MQSYGESYIGRRQQNEDSFAIREPEDENVRASRGCLYVVCDGMGGHSSGKLASSMAVDTVIQGYFNDTTDNIASLQRVVKEASARIFATSQESTDDAAMGCTLVACLILNDRAWILHAGDSRAYLRRDGMLKRLTRDHRYVIEVLGLDEEAASNHHMKNRLSRAVGLQADIELAISSVDLQGRDQILLCSDGLNSVMTDDMILSYLSRFSPIQSVKHLLANAQALGVDDNTTTLVINIGSTNNDTGTDSTNSGNDNKPISGLQSLFHFLHRPRL